MHGEQEMRTEPAPLPTGAPQGRLRTTQPRCSEDRAELSSNTVSTDQDRIRPLRPKAQPSARLGQISRRATPISSSSPTRSASVQNSSASPIAIARMLGSRAASDADNEEG